MLLLPITTDHAETKRAPLANIFIVVLTCLTSIGLPVAAVAALVHRGGDLSDLGFVRHFMLIRGSADPLQLVGHTLLHAGGWHLLGNMVLLVCFGNPVNARLGHLRYLALYAASAAAGGLGWLLLGDGAVAIGASGAVCGVMAAFLVLFPFTRVNVLFWFLGVVLAVGTLVWSLLGLESSIGLLSLAGGLALATTVWGVISLLDHAPPEGAFLRLLGFRTFPAAGIWAVLYFLAWDVVALFSRFADQVAHEAHLGGALVGLTVASALVVVGVVRGTREDPTLPELLKLVRQPAPPPPPPAPTWGPPAAPPPTLRLGRPPLSFEEFARQRRLPA
ncbi:MAG: rhomboid family intramembrane serine protease [Planctomycetes bacterium]|nr:rhomboid family intramembrane serine protease [Planctomycetota bacterium]